MRCSAKAHMTVTTLAQRISGNLSGNGPAQGAPQNSGLRDAIQVYLHWLSVEGRANATIRDYQRDLSAFAGFLEAQGQSPDVGALSPLSIVLFLDGVKRQGRAPETVRGYYRVLSAFFTWAQTWEMVKQSPMEKLKPPKVPRVRKGFLKPDEFARLLAVCPPSTFLGARRQAMLQLFKTSGLRLSELASLQLDDLNWQGSWLRVRMGKGAKERRAPFTKSAQRAMLRYFAHRHDTLPCVWITEERTPMKQWGVSIDMRRIQEKSGVHIKDACHIFRRTWAADARRKRIPDPYIMAMAGWSSPAMLTHYTWSMMQEDEAIGAFSDE